MERAHTGDEQFVSFFLQGVDVDDMVVKMLGPLEIGKLSQQGAQLLTAADDHGHQSQCIRQNTLDIIAIQAQEHIFDLIGHLVNILTEEDNVLPLDGGNECLGENVEHFMLLFIRSVLHRVHFVQLFLDLSRVKFSHCPVQQASGLTRKVSAGAEIVKVEHVLFFCH